MSEIKPYEPSRGLTAKLNRRLVQWRFASPVNIRPPRPLLSITFDDCPKTATTAGGRILDRYNTKACFYIASKLIDTDTVMGRIADKDDLRAMYAAGHEIAAHTHSHIDCAQTPAKDVIQDVEQNLEELTDITKGQIIQSFAFPFGETSYALKQKLSERFTNLRGVLSGNNRGLVDRAHLRAFEINGDPKSVDRILSALHVSADMPAWTILFTHDVSPDPSGFGMTPAQLERVIETANMLGIEIDTPANIVQKLGVLDQ